MPHVVVLIIINFSRRKDEKQLMRIVPIVPFPTDVGTNAKNSVHSSVLDLFEEPDDVVVSLEVVLQTHTKTSVVNY